MNDDTTFVAKSYADSMLGDFEQFVDDNLEHMVYDEDALERERLAHLQLVAATGGLATAYLHPKVRANTELMVIHLGDVFYYLTALCSAAGIPLDAVMDQAIEEHIVHDYEGENFN